MKQFVLAVVATVALACGNKSAPQTAPVAPPPTPFWVDVIACKAPLGTQCVPIPGATIQLHYADGYKTQTANTDGYTVWQVPADLPDSDAIIDAPGYVTARAHIDVLHTHDGQKHNLVAVESAGLDLSSVDFETLAKVRGAMWPEAGFAGLPFGPRPGDPTNIISTGSWHCYNAAQRDAIAAELHRRGLTHVAYGPIGLPSNESYHGEYCDTPNDFATWLDDLEDLESRGFLAIVFIKPDNWTFDQTRDYFTSILSSPRAQKLIRIQVPTGWEPWGYNASSCTWAQFIAWGRATLPNSLILMHNADKPDGSPYDAPVGGDALCNDDGHPNGEGWQRVFDAGLDGWLIQTGPATTPPASAPNLREWCAMYQADGDGAMFHSIAWHFAHGIGGFPTLTKAGRKFLLIDGESTAFSKYHGRLTEADAEAWSDTALKCGADGSFDR